jgi:2-amino-4-hydroxy-6-hydroxymethyldihydropteridine diphosphokinase
MTRAFLALGSNLGDRAAELRRAVASTPDLIAQSAVYETDPVGGPENQGPYLNMVVQLDTSLGPRDLLATCRTLETAAHRRRDIHWGPRTLDVDVLWIDGVTVDDADLKVPHPRIWERPFVLAPLAELAPDLVPPGWEGRFERLGVERLGPLAETNA